MNVNAKNKIQDVDVQSITNQITMVGVITTLILVAAVADIQDIITQIVDITKVDLVVIKIKE